MSVDYESETYLVGLTKTDLRLLGEGKDLYFDVKGATGTNDVAQRVVVSPNLDCHFSRAYSDGDSLVAIDREIVQDLREGRSHVEDIAEARETYSFFLEAA
jgi:hypothetical protein